MHWHSYCYNITHLTFVKPIKVQSVASQFKLTFVNRNSDIYSFQAANLKAFNQDQAFISKVYS